MKEDLNVFIDISKSQALHFFTSKLCFKFSKAEFWKITSSFANNLCSEYFELTINRVLSFQYGVTERVTSPSALKANKLWLTWTFDLRKSILFHSPRLHLTTDFTKSSFSFRVSARGYQHSSRSRKLGVFLKKWRCLSMELNVFTTSSFIEISKRVSAL